MGKRYVDANILEDLSHFAGRTRGDLEGVFRQCEGRVNGVIRGMWDQGAWADVRGTLWSELTSLDDHGRSLVNRAARVREVAREAALRQLRELWAAIAGLRQKISSEAAWLRKFWENYARSRRKSVLPWPWPFPGSKRPPRWPWPFPPPKWPPPWPWPFPPKWPRVPLPPWWPRPPKPAPTPPKPQPLPSKPAPPLPKPPPAPLKPPLQAAADAAAEAARQVARVGATVEFKSRYPEGTGLVDYKGKYPGECVSLVKRYCDEALGVPLGTFAGDTCLDEWNAYNQPFDPKHPRGFNPALWDQISGDRLAAEGGYRVGDIVFFGDGNNHVGIVTAVLDGGKRVEITDQGWGDPDGSEKVHSRVYSVSDGNPSDLQLSPKLHHHMLGVMRLK